MDDQALLAARERIGRVLRGKYRLDQVLGVGGMAAVYLATHRNTKQFAVKMLHPELSVREALRTRFLREGYVANSVKHAGAVAVLDDDIAEDGSAFLVMELLLGAPVDELWVEHNKRVSTGLVLSIAAALLEVLASAHERGIVHRDLKPANLFVTEDGVLKVLDFGIARLLDDGGASATLTGTMLGTPAFMAPEQALSRAGEIDAQTDLWAVGATMFSLLTGELVHEGDNTSQVLVNAATKSARSLASAWKEAPPALVAVVDKALAFDKKDRWATAAVMREALHQVSVDISGGPVSLLPRVSSRSPRLPPASAAGADSSDAAFAPTVGDSGPIVTPPTARAGITTGGPVATTGSALPIIGGARRARPRSLRGALGVLLALALAGGATAAYRVVMEPRVRVCADVAMTNRGPECLGPIPKALQPGRVGRTAHVTAVLGRVTAVEWVSHGGMESGDPGLYREEVARDGDGLVREVIRRDRQGAVLRWEKWSDAGRRVDLVDIDGTTPRVERDSAISTLHREFNARGQLVKETYFGPTGRPRPDPHGSYGVLLEYGASGRWTKASVLAADGNPGVDLRGQGQELRSDDETPLGRETTYFDSEGQPMLRDGVFRVRATFDQAWNITDEHLFGLKDEPVVDVVLGWNALKRMWDPAARTLEVFDLDEHGHVRPRKGQWSSVLRTTYDDRGRPVLEEYLDTDKNRIRGRSGEPAARRTRWSEADLPAVREELDTDNTLTEGRGGYARRVFVYDQQGREIEQRYFDKAGKPAPRRDGGAGSREILDDRGLIVSIREVDGDGNPAVDGHGVHERRRSWDQFRNKVAEALYGADGRPTTNEDGVSVTRYTYDDNDDLVGVAYFDETSVPIMLRGEVAAEKFSCDERGLRVSAQALDAHGDPTLRKEGYSLVRYERDRNGDVVSEAYFGKDGEKTACLGGYAKKTMKYDVHRRLVETALFDASGAATHGEGGWAVQKITYDARGLVTREARFAMEGKPAVSRERGSAGAKTWDARGNLTEETTVGPDDQPMATTAGYATRRSEYDDRDQVVAELLLMPDGSPANGPEGWSVRRIRYDDVGNVVEEAYFDGNRGAVAPKGMSYTSIRRRFDGQQRLVETSFFDGAGVPATGPDGVATVRYERDGYGRAIQTSYFDGSGAATPTKDGKVVIRATYDIGGRLVEERSLDATFVLRPLADGCAVHQTRYDAHGRKTEDACRDVRELLAVSTDGFAVQRVVYDGRGNGVDIATYDADGQPCLDKEGIFRRKNRYSDHNLVIDTAYFDVNDKPTHDKVGVHETRFAYDETGKPLPASYLDEHGHPVFPENRVNPSPDAGHVDLAFGDDTH